MLARITGNSIPHEARRCSSTYHVVTKIRKRRLLWIGELLRAPQLDRLLTKTIEVQHANHTPGNLLMDAPNLSWPALLALARDLQGWNALVDDIH